MTNITIDIKTTADPKGVRAEMVLPVFCVDDEKRLLYGVAMEPDAVDTHGEYTEAADIETAAHGYMQSRLVGVQHEKEAPAEVVESYIAQGDLTIGGQHVRKGSWVVAIKIQDDALWAAAKAGEFGGISIGGWAVREDDLA